MRHAVQSWPVNAQLPASSVNASSSVAGESEILKRV
jgi:hypothetical protein